MAEKISRQALDNYFACKFKAHLTVSGARALSGSEEIITASGPSRRHKKMTGGTPSSRHSAFRIPHFFYSGPLAGVVFDASLRRT